MTQLIVSSATLILILVNFFITLNLEEEYRKVLKVNETLIEKIDDLEDINGELMEKNDALRAYLDDCK